MKPWSCSKFYPGICIETGVSYEKSVRVTVNPKYKFVIEGCPKNVTDTII
jgi:hypothetical protein